MKPAAPLLLSAATLFALAVGCRRGNTGSDGDSKGEPQPAASVIQISAVLGNCPDLAACERACDAGVADGCRRLAGTFALGQGVDQDEPRAAALYVRSCELKDPAACVFAGQMYEYAHGVTKDAARASSFYERSCDLGWPTGCYNLAIMAEHGRGIPKDRERAGNLYQVACTAGAKVACDKAREMHSPEAPPFFDGGLP